MKRLRIGKHGELRLPQEVLTSLGILPGSYVTITIAGKKLSVEKADYNPLDDFGKGPDKNALEKAIHDEKKRAEKADKTFEKLMENPPEVRPEDRPDFWD